MSVVKWRLIEQRRTLVSLVSIAVCAVYVPDQVALGAKHLQRAASVEWVHLTVSSGPGRRVESDIWFGIGKHVEASRNDDEVRYFRKSEQFLQVYRKADGVIVELSSADSGEQLASDQLLRLINGEAPVTLGDIEILRTGVDRQTTTEIERPVLLKRLDVPCGEGVVTVDQATSLPRRMFLTIVPSGDPVPFSRLIEFEYPATGPQDIYALGVPRNVERDDRRPSSDLQFLLNALQTGRGKLERYSATIVDTNGVVRRISRNASKWRVDVGEGAAALDFGALSLRSVPERNSAILEAATKYSLQPVLRSDGGAVYRAYRTADSTNRMWRKSAPLTGRIAQAIPKHYPEARFLLEFICFPDITAGLETKTTLLATHSNSAGSTSKVERITHYGGPDHVEVRESHTLDSRFDFAATEWNEVYRSNKKTHTVTCEYSDFWRFGECGWIPTKVTELRQSNGNTHRVTYFVAVDCGRSFDDRQFAVD